MSVIIEIDRAKEAQIRGDASSFCRHFSAFLSEWKNLNLPGPLPTLKDVEAITRNLDRSVRSWVYDHTPSLKELPLEKDAVLKMVKVPDLTNLEYWAKEINIVRFISRVEHFDIEDTKVVPNALLDAYIESQTKKIIKGRRAMAQMRAEELLGELNAFAKQYPEICLMQYRSGDTHYVFQQDGAGKKIVMSKEPFKKIN